MPSVSQDSRIRFAALQDDALPTPRPGWRFAQLFLAPFRDVDERVTRLAAAKKREREAHETLMSAAAEPRR